MRFHARGVEDGQQLDRFGRHRGRVYPVLPDIVHSYSCTRYCIFLGLKELKGLKRYRVMQVAEESCW